MLTVFGSTVIKCIFLSYSNLSLRKYAILHNFCKKNKIKKEVYHYSHNIKGHVVFTPETEIRKLIGAPD